MARTIKGRRTVATVVPAAVQLAASPDAGQPESEQLAASVAHEDGRLSAATEVVRQEAEAGESERERQDDDEVVVVDRRAVDREVRTGNRGERCGEAVHVVEEIERVRDPHEPDDRDDATATMSFVNSST